MKNIIVLVGFWLCIQSIPAQKKVALYWDVSYSMNDRKIDRELRYIDNYFKKHQEVNVVLIMFSNDIILKEDYGIKA